MLFSDLDLARRLERAEGSACREFAMARSRIYPGVGAAWMECAGTYAMFDGPDSPITQTFGLGLFAEATPEALDALEAFFFERGAAVMQEVSPLAGVATLDRLAARGYRPLELSSVLYRMLTLEDTPPASSLPAGITVRVTAPEDAAEWVKVSARGWAGGYPELLPFVEQLGELATAREHSICFLAELEGCPGAAGVLSIDEGVALFGGASTIPEMRGRGLQAALLNARLRYACESGCDLAMMVTEVGSQSQRNAERAGLRIAYTRTKWKLNPPRERSVEAAARVPDALG